MFIVQNIFEMKRIYSKNNIFVGLQNLFEKFSLMKN